jgi:hypothetical protein
MARIDNFLNSDRGIGGTFFGGLTEMFKGPSPSSSAGLQRTENVRARTHAAEEAQKARDFSERMSNTSYQRMVQDAQAAGINPALAINAGGASTPTGTSTPSSASQTRTTGGAGLRGLAIMAGLLAQTMNTGAKIAIASQKATGNVAQKALSSAIPANAARIQELNGGRWIPRTPQEVGAAMRGNANVQNMGINQKAINLAEHKRYMASIDPKHSAKDIEMMDKVYAILRRTAS